MYTNFYVNCSFINKIQIMIFQKKKKIFAKYSIFRIFFNLQIVCCTKFFLIILQKTILRLYNFV